MNLAGVFIMTHAPLASALKACALHTYAEAEHDILVLDVQPSMGRDETEAAARILLENFGHDRVLVLTDAPGATPHLIAERLIDGRNSKLVSGVNVPMLWSLMGKRHETLDDLVQRAVNSGTAGITIPRSIAPQHQTRPAALSAHDQQYRHQQ